MKKTKIKILLNENVDFALYYYTIIKCNNCNYKGRVYIPVGEKIKYSYCPNCDCDTLELFVEKLL